MSKRILAVLGAGAALLAGAWWLAGPAHGVGALDAAAEEKAVRATVEKFVNAFNAGDAAGMAAQFTAQAEFIDDQGQGVQGKAEIERVMKGFLEANKGAKLQVNLDGLRLVSPTVALEDGESVVTVADKGVQTSRRYAMVFAKEGGAWQIASVREFPEAEETPDPAEQLKALEWTLGDWVDESPDGLVVTTGKWSEDKKFILREYTVSIRGQASLKGTQRIGVDPFSGLVKSWAHDSQGGHGEGTWHRDGGRWIVKSQGVSAEGDTVSATYVFTPDGPDKVEMKILHLVVGDKVEPDATITLVRKAPQAK